MTEGHWGVATWAFIEKNTLDKKIMKMNTLLPLVLIIMTVPLFLGV